MTRIESIKLQVRELTPSERQKLRQWMDESPEIADENPLSEEFDGTPTPAQLAEIYRRIEEFESGAVQGIDADVVMEELLRRHPA